MLRDKLQMMIRNQYISYSPSYPRPLFQILPSLVERVKTQHQAMQHVHNCSRELAARVIGRNKPPIPLSTQKHVEQLLNVLTWTQTNQREPDNVNYIWQIPIMKCIFVIQHHPIQRAVSVKVNSQQVAIQPPPHTTIILQFRMQH
jgi:hypothetical protein